VVTAEDYDQALHFYRYVLGLKQRAAFVSEGGHVTILEAGQATLAFCPSSSKMSVWRVLRSVPW